MITERPLLFRVEGIDSFKVRNKRSASSLDDKTDQEGTEEEEEELEDEVDNETHDQGFTYSV